MVGGWDCKMKKTALVVLAKGFEEIEAVTPIDVLRRADVKVIVAGVGGTEIEGAHGVTFKTDTTIEKYSEIPDVIILPGGMPGASNLSKSEALKKLLNKMKDAKKNIAAICASPAVVLGREGFLENRTATCYPGFEKYLGSDVKFSEDRVVRDGIFTTSRGPGTALEFSLELVKQLIGQAKADELAQAMIVQ